MADRISWRTAELDYVTSGDRPTLEEIATKYNVSPRSVARHSSTDGWIEKRRAFDSETALATRSLAAERQIESNIDSLHIVEIIVQDLSAIAERIVQELATRDLETIRSDALIDTLPRVSNALEKGVRAISFLKGGPDSRIDTSFADLAIQARERSQTARK